MNKIKSLLVLFLFLAMPAQAATNDLTFSENTTVSGLNLYGGVTDMTVFSGSSAESFDISEGVLTISNPSAGFRIGSSNAGVGTIVILKSGLMESCVVNSIPGTSSTTLPSASGVYTVRPLVATNCSSLCPTLTGATTYSAYPTCGAVTCSSGYSLSGAGSSAVCTANSSGGGGGGGGGGTTVTPVVKATSTSTVASTTAITNPLPIDTTILSGLGAREIVATSDIQKTQIVNDSSIVMQSGTDLNLILAHLNVKKDVSAQANSMNKYIPELKKGIKGLTLNNIYAINNFIVYGTITTRKLGAGERAGVISSYKKAFAKLPVDEKSWNDCIAIANGRWPSETSASAEKMAKTQFQKIYKKIPDMNNAKDKAAIAVMAYGLRQKAENRNLDSERSGIKTFKSIYGKNPTSTEDWNIMQAITYSGASRGVDSDGDLLTDDREKALGTDPKKKDTDGDGYTDGDEVAYGYDPLKK